MEEGVIRISEVLCQWKCLTVGIEQFLCSLCVAQPKLLVGLPLHVTGLLKLGENWKVGRDGDRSALLEQAAGDGHSPSWFLLSATFLAGGGVWQLYWSFCCLPFQKGSAWTIFVPLVFPSQWEARETAAVTPCSAAVARASKGIVAACMMCKENNFIFHQCYIQKQNFQHIFKALCGKDCLENYGKNTGKIQTSGTVP